MKRTRLISFAIGTILLGCSSDDTAANRPATTGGGGATATTGSGGAATGSSTTGSAGGTSVTTGTAGATSTSSGSAGTTGTGGGGGRGGSGGAAGAVDAGADARTDAATDGGAPLKGRNGGTCIANMTYPSPLPASPRATLIKANVGSLEGPVWVASQNALFICLYTTDPMAGRIHKYTPADGNIVVFVDNVGVAGLALDPNGQIVAASQDKQRLTRFDPATGARTDVMGGSMYMGSPFNQVNDVVVRSDGNMYFSDPDYSRAGRPGQNAQAYYRLSPQGVVTRLGTGNEPNG